MIIMKPFFLLVLLLAVSCRAPSHPTLRITDEEAAHIVPGMSIEAVQGILGHPWQLVLIAGDNSREVHRYVMQRVNYATTKERDVAGFGIDGTETRVETIATRRSQYRVLDIHYKGGVVVGPE
jgi:hypothetical protein